MIMIQQQLDTEGKLLPPKLTVMQPGDSQTIQFTRDNRFCTAFISKLCPAIRSSICLLIFALPFLVIPLVKRPGTEFCNGYWKDQANAQFSGMVTLILVDSSSSNLFDMI